MEIIKSDKFSTKIAVQSGLINLTKTFDCGQCFRWDKIGSLFTGITNKGILHIKELGTNQGKDYFIISEPENNIQYVVDYLGLNDDYSYLSTIQLTDIEKSMVEFGKGIRILHQDIWETIVSFIISQRNNIPKIKTSINRLCDRLGSDNNKNYYDRFEQFKMFPTAEQILTGGRKVLDDCGLGYRTDYILLIAQEFINNKAEFLKYLGDEYTGQETVDFLQQFKGIGPKVANCIALFGYNKLDMFPIDVWIQRAIDKEFNGSIDIYKYGKLAGLMQQYIFYYEKN